MRLLLELAMCACWVCCVATVVEQPQILTSLGLLCLAAAEREQKASAFLLLSCSWGHFRNCWCA
jgi:hypothetical protein